MKQRNLALQAAVAAAFGLAGAGANAGSLSGSTLFATNLFGATSTAAAPALTVQPITYTFSAQPSLLVNNGGAITMYLRLSSGTFGAIGAGGISAGDFVITTAGLTLTFTAIALSADKTTAAILLSNNTGANQSIGIGATAVYTPQAGGVQIGGTSSPLASSGGTVSFSSEFVAASTLPTNGSASFNSGTALPAPIGSEPLVTAALVSSSSAVTVTATASSAFTAVSPETAKISVASVPAQTAFTTSALTGTTNIVNLGDVVWNNAVAAPNQADGVTQYTTNSIGAIGAVVSGDFSGSGAKVFISRGDPTCATTSYTAVITTGKATFTGIASQPAATYATQPDYVCYQVTAAGGTVALPPSSYSITETTTPAVATDASVSLASTPLYSLSLNGTSINIRTYIPAAVSGYASYLRFINTSSVPGPVSVAVIDPGTGAVGASAVVITNLAAGGATTLTATQIEAGVGAVTATSRPRLRVTAPMPSGALQVQVFGTNPDGTFTTLHGYDVQP